MQIVVGWQKFYDMGTTVFIYDGSIVSSLRSDFNYALKLKGRILQHKELFCFFLIIIFDKKQE